MSLDGFIARMDGGIEWLPIAYGVPGCRRMSPSSVCNWIARSMRSRYQVSMVIIALAAAGCGAPFAAAHDPRRLRRPLDCHSVFQDRGNCGCAPPAAAPRFRAAPTGARRAAAARSSVWWLRRAARALRVPTPTPATRAAFFRPSAALADKYWTVVDSPSTVIDQRYQRVTHCVPSWNK